ncbi:MAG: antibiotic biosynthesis monooxygenase [Alphaproteobacteria bacterium]|nr:antibiotic biosynthesis monooxygenase [Alphaproteobacteria bacterium]
MIHVVATITAKPGMRAQILEAFRANMPAVHAEPGCIEYGPAIDAEGAGGIQTKLGADAFVVIEKWESLEALRAHAASPHMASYTAKTRDIVASRVIHVLQPG